MLNQQTDGFIALRERPWVFLALLLLVLLLCYLPAVGGDFFIDDRKYTLLNPLITDTPLWQFWRLFITMPEMEYLPIRDLSYLIDYQLFGENPFGYKLHNLLLYLLLTCAVWLFSRELLPLLLRSFPSFTYRESLALLLTALFVLHPSHVESVSWIAGRKDLLASLFAFLALWLFTLSLQASRHMVVYRIAATLLFGCALLSKSVVVPLGGFAWLLAFWAARSQMAWRGALLYALRVSWPLLLLSLAGVMLHLWVGVSLEIGHEMGQLNVVVSREPLTLAAYIITTLLQISLWPINLRLQYDVFPAPGFVWWPWLLAAGLLIASLYAVMVKAWRGVCHPAWFGLPLFMMFILPYLQLVPFDTWSLASERFLLVAVYGMMLSLLLLSLSLPRRWRYGLLAAVMLFYVGQSALRVLEWRDNQQLFASNWQNQPEYFANAALRIRNLDMVNSDWPQALKVAEGIEHESFRDGMLALIRFQYYLSRPEEDNEKLYSALQQLKILHQAIERSKGALFSLAHYNFYRDITGLAVNAYLQMLRYAPDSVQLHFAVAQMHLNHNADYSREDAEAHLLHALRLARQQGQATAPIRELLQSLP